MRRLTTKADRIFLVGPMGVGKTTVGKLLAEELGLAFIDCDQVIEDRAGASIAWIFDMEGEAGFRDRETRVLEELTNRAGVLLATGGGVVTRASNRTYLRRHGVVVYLNASVELLVERTAKDKRRPLLQQADPAQIHAKLNKERDPLYRQVADVNIHLTTNNSKKAVELTLQALTDAGYILDHD